jgi:hypothetical protein
MQASERTTETKNYFKLNISSIIENHDGEEWMEKIYEISGYRVAGKTHDFLTQTLHFLLLHARR